MGSSTNAYRPAAALTAQRGEPIRGRQVCIWSGQGHVEDERWVVGLVVDGAGRGVREGGDAIGRGAVALVNVSKRGNSWVRLGIGVGMV